MADNSIPLTVFTRDIAVLYCLRGLANYCEGHNKFAVVKGTTDDDWKANNWTVVFHFDKPEYVEKFVEEGKRLLPGLWKPVPETVDS